MHKKKTLVVAVVLLAAVWAWWDFGYERLVTPNRVTVYCPNAKAPIVYTLIPERQMVIEAILHEAVTKPTRHTDCIVGSRDSWECGNAKGVFRFGVRHGEWFHRLRSDGSPVFEPRISRTSWYVMSALIFAEGRLLELLPHGTGE